MIVGLATAVIATPIGLSSALAFRAMTRYAKHILPLHPIRDVHPRDDKGLGLSVIFKVVRVKPSWLTVTIGHLLWALPFAFTVSLVVSSA